MPTDGRGQAKGVKRSVLVRTGTLAQVAQLLTGHGRIVGIDHEGTISYEIEGADEFELGRLAAAIQCELQSYDTGAEVISAAARDTRKPRKSPSRRHSPGVARSR